MHNEEKKFIHKSLCKSLEKQYLLHNTRFKMSQTVK